MDYSRWWVRAVKLLPTMPSPTRVKVLIGDRLGADTLTQKSKTFLQEFFRRWSWKNYLVKKYWKDHLPDLIRRKPRFIGLFTSWDREPSKFTGLHAIRHLNAFTVEKIATVITWCPSWSSLRFPDWPTRSSGEDPRLLRLASQKEP